MSPLPPTQFLPLLNHFTQEYFVSRLVELVRTRSIGFGDGDEHLETDRSKDSRRSENFN